jgi:hypothetical protein
MQPEDVCLEIDKKTKARKIVRKNCKYKNNYSKEIVIIGSLIIVTCMIFILFFA